MRLDLGIGAALVAITAPCAFVDPWAAVLIGAVAGAAVPPLVVAADGTASGFISLKPENFTAKSNKLTVGELRGHALVVHDAEVPHARIACGIVIEGDPEIPR